jgi:hypothetical protein
LPRRIFFGGAIVFVPGREAIRAPLHADTDPAEGSRVERQRSGHATRQKAQRNLGLREVISAREELIERIHGSFYEYAGMKYQELRFGAAVESALGIVREQVDASIAELVPDALPKLSAAFENITSNNRKTGRVQPPPVGDCSKRPPMPYARPARTKTIGL